MHASHLKTTFARLQTYTKWSPRGQEPISLLLRGTPKATPSQSYTYTHEIKHAKGLVIRIPTEHAPQTHLENIDIHTCNGTNTMARVWSCNFQCPTHCKTNDSNNFWREHAPSDLWTGKSPMAVSLVRIRPQHPSKTAFATSPASALVGLFFFIIVAKSYLPVKTGVPEILHWLISHF